MTKRGQVAFPVHSESLGGEESTHCSCRIAVVFPTLLFRLEIVRWPEQKHLVDGKK
jgi:hypothetical protein